MNPSTLPQNRSRIALEVCGNCHHNEDVPRAGAGILLDYQRWLQDEMQRHCDGCGLVGCITCMQACPHCGRHFCAERSKDCALLSIDGLDFCLVCAYVHITGIAEAANVKLPTPKPLPTLWERIERWWVGVLKGGVRD